MPSFQTELFSSFLPSTYAGHCNLAAAKVTVGGREGGREGERGRERGGMGGREGRDDC